MTVFSDTEAKNRLDAILDAAESEGSVRIRRGDGREYVLRLVDPARSPLDVGYVNIRPTREEIVQAVREGRERH